MLFILQLEGEILQAYRQLRQMCLEIKSQLRNRAADDTEDTQSVISTDSESLNVVVTELRDTIHSAIEQANQVECFIQGISVYQPITVSI